MKYDKYSIIAANRRAVALRPVINLKMNYQIRAQGEGGHALSCTPDKAAATADEVRTADKICDEMLTHSSCEIGRAFDRNANAVNNKFYEEENEDGLMFMEELDDNTGGRLTLASSMNDDLEEI